MVAYDNHAPPNESWHKDAVLVPMVLTTDTPRVTVALPDGTTPTSRRFIRGTVWTIPAEVTLAYDG